MPAQGDREGTRLLGDNNRHGIGNLRDADRCAMAHSERFLIAWIMSKRKLTGCRLDAVSYNYDSPVVEGSMRSENCNEKL